jgi:hypothetical protein
MTTMSPHMATITIGIDGYPADSSGGIHYVFPWEGDEKEARASIKYTGELAAKIGVKPGNLSRVVLCCLNELLANANDLPIEHKAAILAYALCLVVKGSDGEWRTVLQQLAYPGDVLVTITAQHLGGKRGCVKGTARFRASGEGAVTPLRSGG